MNSAQMISGVSTAFPRMFSRFATVRFATITTLLGAAILVSIFAIVQHANLHPSPAKVVADYIDALENHDIKRCLDLSEGMVGEIAQIKANNPRALWDKLIQEHYDKSIQAFNSVPEVTENLNMLYPHGVSWKITETRRTPEATIVYVTFDFPTLEQAPYENGKFLKQSMTQFNLSPKSGLMIGFDRVEAGNVFYENVPPMIFTAAWSSDNMAHDIYLHATAAGGAAPFHWNVQCGDLTFSSVTMMFKDTTGNRQTKIGVRLKEPYPKEPLECEMRIADDGGNADRVAISIPHLFTPMLDNYCFMREPWSLRQSVKLERQRCMGKTLPMRPQPN